MQQHAHKYCFKAIMQISDSCPGEVNCYLKQYPFKECAESFIRRVLYDFNIYSSNAMYDDCYDAGMVAYLYSIHRCAAMKYANTQAYIKKMIRIYVICAIAVYKETNNLCKMNGFGEIRFDADYSNSQNI